MPGPEGAQPSNPLETARRLTAPVRPKRFYKSVEMVEAAGRFALRLDGKKAMTPGKQPLAVPGRDSRRGDRGGVERAGRIHRPGINAGDAAREQRHRRRFSAHGGGA